MPSNLFIMFAFPDTESGLCFMHIFDVAMFKYVFYKIN
jgi:hypothetical protein